MATRDYLASQCLKVRYSMGILCRMVKLRRALLYFAVVFVPLAGLVYVVWPRHGLQVATEVPSCSNKQSKLYLEELCSNYTKGLVTGKLCSPLCLTKEIRFQQCLGHGLKLHVLKAKWNQDTVILKTPKGYKLYARVQVGDVVTKRQFIQQANLSIFSDLTKYSPTTQRVLEDIVTGCDVHADGVMYYDELMICWQLIKTVEYMRYALLRGRSGIPDMYGNCGLMYAVQFANPKPFLGYETIDSDQRSWKYRARLSLALLDMIESVEETPYGAFHICDMQEANFGVVEKDDKLVAKAIDVDIAFFQSQTATSTEQHAKHCKIGHSNCNVIGCIQEQTAGHSCCNVRCDTPTASCKKEFLMASNNLQSLCQILFQQYASWHPALLRNPPKSIKSQLEALLAQCVNPDRGSSHIPKDILEEFRHLLHSSIDYS